MEPGGFMENQLRVSADEKDFVVGREDFLDSAFSENAGDLLNQRLLLHSFILKAMTISMHFKVNPDKEWPLTISQQPVSALWSQEPASLWADKQKSQ